MSNKEAALAKVKKKQETKLKGKQQYSIEHCKIKILPWAQN